MGLSGRTVFPTGTYDAEGRLEITISGVPPVQTADKRIPFSQYLTADGTAGGSNDMRVDGSSDAVEFWVPTHSTRDRYISTLFITISDQSATLDKFGNITALTNGCQLEYVHPTEGAVTLNGSLKSNYHFVQLCGGNPSFGDAAAAFRANNISGNSEGYLCRYDFDLTHGVLHGLRLRAGTSAKLILRVRDDIRAIDAFTIRATGLERLPD
jgi:hypothetical protein